MVRTKDSAARDVRGSDPAEARARRLQRVVAKRAEGLGADGSGVITVPGIADERQSKSYTFAPKFV